MAVFRGISATPAAGAPGSTEVVCIAAFCTEEIDRGGYGQIGCADELGLMRWLIASIFAIVVHAAVAAIFLLPVQSNPRDEGFDAISVELMSDPVEHADKLEDSSGSKTAESISPTDKIDADDPTPAAANAAPPTEKKPAPEPAPEALAPPPVHADAELTAKDPDKPPPDPPVEAAPDAKKDVVERRIAASTASSGSTAELAGGRRLAASAKASWAGEIGTHLSRLRRYPREARAEGWQGTARVRVTIDANGHVRGRELVESSGHSSLDTEALDLMRRSDPFPRPPVGMSTPVALTVPVKFAIR